MMGDCWLPSVWIESLQSAEAKYFEARRTCAQAGATALAQLESELHYEVLPVSADDGQAITVYAAERGSPSEDALRLLASLDATRRQAGDEPDGSPQRSVLDGEERTF